MKKIVLKNKALELTFNAENGALCGIKAGSWTVFDRPALGLSFRMLLPTKERRNNPVYGTEQKLSGYTISEDGKNIVFRWDSLTSRFGGKHEIRVTASVGLGEESAVFGMQIENASGGVVEDVYYPYLADVTAPEDSEWLRAFAFNYSTAYAYHLRPDYENHKGYYGSDYPVQYFAQTPSNNFVLLMGEKRGLYFEAVNDADQLVAWHTELHPGWENSLQHTVPTEKIGPEENAVRFAAVHMPYLNPGKTLSLSPVIMQMYEGDWHNGADIYKANRAKRIKDAVIPQWAQEPHSWMQIQINSPEDELRFTYKDFVEVGRECARHGVKAIQLVGWNDGGQDQNNPSHDTDPRLGTFEEFKEAIAEVRALGVKVILFTKFTWADRATERFRKDLIRLAIKDPYGDYCYHPGYQYFTAAQMLDINPKRFVPMCFLSDEYLEVCNKEFKKCVDLGADGILFDECLAHGTTKMCFDPDHGHEVGAYVFANDRKLIENFSKIVKNDQFLYAGEGCYDMEFEAYHISYFRTDDDNHVPYMRYLLPYQGLMIAVTGFNDRNIINECLMYRYIVSYEPYNFKGKLEDYPLTLEYGKKMDALRTELREYFWDGEFRDTVGVIATSESGAAHKRYTVFLNKKNGLYGVVACNYSGTDSVKVKLTADNGQSFEHYRLVGEDEERGVSEYIEIPPYSAVVVY